MMIQVTKGQSIFHEDKKPKTSSLASLTDQSVIVETFPPPQMGVGLE